MRTFFQVQIFVLLFCLLISLPALAKRDGLHADQIFIHDGVERLYDLYVPPGYEKTRMPLVVILHGHGGNAQMVTRKRNPSPYKAWLDIADREGLILLLPVGVKSPDGWRGWNDCRGDSKVLPSTDDVGFLRSLIHMTIRQKHADPARVYVTGTSNGAFMTLRMALEAQDLVAAAAPVVAAMAGKSECMAGSKKVPILFMDGTADPLVHYEGGYVGSKKDGQKRGLTLSIPDSVAWWVRHNGAASKPAFSKFPDKDPDDDSTVEKYVYGGKAPVVLIKMIGAGHTEPSLRWHYGWLYTMIVKKQNKDIEMAEEVWSFFRDKRLQK